MERLAELLAHENGVLPRRDHHNIRHLLDSARRKGLLAAPLPGIYTAPDPDWHTRMRAVAAFRPGCVITGAAAALALWWPEVPITFVSATVPYEVHGTYARYQWQRRRVPADLIDDSHGLRLASPAVSVLDLLPTLGATVIDEALRRRAVTLAALWAALRAEPRRPGNRLRGALLTDSRDEPWSEAERVAHRLLRQAGLVGWRTNHRIVIDGVGYFADIAFTAERVIIEIDGFTHHGTRQAFADDRWRYSRFAAHGWRVLPFAASSLDDDPEAFVALVRRAVGQ